ncbi:SA1320 family protein [Gemella sanguinis]|uniref:SA1320 family protein n=1 Tax=Gemella sanguinis TaxID=84135 RepID=UPI00068F6308|nr:Mbeg1-like protein [Gemella sanguinis]NKZ26348.1 DUF2974 domain-containing protein [Gemella sanguinis]
MENSTLYASNYTYAFEKARIEGYGDEDILEQAQKIGDFKIPYNLEYLDDIYDESTGTSATAFKDKDTGEVIISYTGTNKDTDKMNDIVKSDIGEIAMGISAEHYKPAYKFYQEIKEKYGDNIVLTGHSLGGNIAQRVALEYNVPKTVVYNAAPLYIPREEIIPSTLGILQNEPKFKKDILAVLFKLREIPYKWMDKFGNSMFNIPNEEIRIKQLEKNFTGEVIRFRSEEDILNDAANYANGKYLGAEYILKDSGKHMLSDIIDSRQACDEISKITKMLGYNQFNIDIDGDYKADIEIGKLDLSVKDLFSDNGKLVELNSEKIQLNPEILRSLSNNLRTNVLSDIANIKRINNLCIERNNKTRFDFEQRKNQAADEIKKEFNNAQVPQVLDNLKNSIGKIINSKDVLEKLSETYSLKMEEFSSDEKPYVNDNELNETSYNTQLASLRMSAEPLLEQCNKEKTYDITSFFSGRPTILKSWQAIEANTKKLLEESEKTLEGDGLRTGKEDGISQALTTVLDTAKNNIEELEKAITNTAELCQGLADNFVNQDSWIGQNLRSGKFVGSAPERVMPASYEEYLERDEIFDDVKNVLQAFDNQVEKRSEEFAKKVSELYRESFRDFERGLENWYSLIGDFEGRVSDIVYNYNLDVYVEKKCEDNGKSTTKKDYWGKFIQLYPQGVKEGIAGAQSNILPFKKNIEQTIETSKNTKNNLSSLEPQLKQIIEGAVYKGLDLDEIVNSQKVIMEISEKIKQELIYVEEHISGEGMSGQSISALNNKLKENENSVEYYRNLVSDCFVN